MKAALNGTTVWLITKGLSNSFPGSHKPSGCHKNVTCSRSSCGARKRWASVRLPRAESSTTKSHQVSPSFGPIKSTKLLTSEDGRNLDSVFITRTEQARVRVAFCRSASRERGDRPFRDRAQSRNRL